MALIHCHFFSQVLGMMSTMSVLLPDPQPSAVVHTATGRGPRWPTLYLLHGLSDDHTVWLRRTSLERYAENLQLAIVMPAANRSFYVDMAAGHRYWTFISEEVPAVARHFFPLAAEREANFVAGLSMGGYGAMKLALTHPERYAAAASLSGVLDVARYARDELANGQAEMRHIFGDPAALASSANDLFFLASLLTASDRPRPRLYQWCGSEDFLYADNLRFREHAQGLNLSTTYEEGPGGHDWSCWDTQIQRVLQWLPG